MTLRETLGRIAKAPTPPNEEAAKLQFILPVLRDLGWDVDNISGTSEVRPEEPAGATKGGGRVDIALMGQHDQCACFVEAKSPGANLDDHVDQLLRYAFHDGVTVCVLTDGLEWWLYLPREAGPPDKRRFALLRLRDDPVEQSADDLEAFLSRDAVRSGKAERDAAKVLKRLQEESDIARRLPEIWSKMLTKPDEELVDLVRSKVYAELRLSPSAEQVAAVLSGRSVASSRPAPSSEPARPAPSTPETRKQRVKSPKITGATVLGVTESMSSWTKLVVFTAERLLALHPHDFLEKTRNFKGSKRDYVSKSTHNMTSPRQIGSSGIFVEAGWSGHVECKRQSRRMLELFGYSDSDLQIHEE